MTLRIGIIGANPEKGWAGQTHVPAVRAVPELSLAAIATSNAKSAAKAEQTWQVRGYSNPLDLIADSNVDVVVVSVRTPLHAPLVEAALTAGKAVYCEWPLGRNLRESESLAKRAAELNAVTAIGLQGRASPWVRGLGRLLSDGYVGDIQSVSLTAWDLFSTGTISPQNAYTIDPSNGATPLTIMGGHILDVVFQLVGEPADVKASGAITVPEIVVESTGERFRALSSDQTMVTGRLRNGAAFSAHIRAGAAVDETARLEIQGTDGFLRATVGSGFIHWSPLAIWGSRHGRPLEPISLPANVFDPDLTLPPGPAHNLAYAYRAFGRRVAGQGDFPTFADAYDRHYLIDLIEREQKRL